MREEIGVMRDEIGVIRDEIGVMRYERLARLPFNGQAGE
jgi:hypothetical protein